MRLYPLFLLCLSLPLVLAASGASAQLRTAPAVQSRVADDGWARVIVELDEPAMPEGWLGRAAARAQRRRIGGAQGALLDALAGSDARRTRPYAGLPFVALEVGPRALAVLQRSGRVRAIREDRALPPLLASTAPIVQADQAEALGLDGAGQMIVMLDTGVDGGHQNFGPGRIVAEACFARGFGPNRPTGDCPNGLDVDVGPGAGAPCDYSWECDHGTHVAGIAAGKGPRDSGVARGADIASIQVFSEFPSLQCGGGGPCPRSYVSDQDAALSFVFDELAPLYDVAAVNLSLGGGAWSSTAQCDNENASTKALIDQLRSIGIATVIASGNNSCAGRGCNNSLSGPACISSAISVGATDDADNRAGFGNVAPFLSLFAPGVNVTAPLFGTVAQYIAKDGTSMAAPHVAGAWAILYQADPSIGVDETLDLLRATGEPVQHTSRIRIRAALDELELAACSDAVDNDGDGLVDMADPGCADGADPQETNPDVACDDAVDNDGDGLVDLADPGCRDGTWITENPKCNDGIDNDEDGGTDFDGSPPDEQCKHPWKNTEACGLGAELVFAILPLLAWRRRLARPRP